MLLALTCGSIGGRYSSYAKSLSVLQNSAGLMICRCLETLQAAGLMEGECEDTFVICGFIRSSFVFCPQTVLIIGCNNGGNPAWQSHNAPNNGTFMN